MLEALKLRMDGVDEILVGTNLLMVYDVVRFYIEPAMMKMQH
jgi:hypothetical protein